LKIFRLLGSFNRPGSRWGGEKLLSDSDTNERIEHGGGCKLNVVRSGLQTGLHIMGGENTTNSDQPDAETPLGD